MQVGSKTPRTWKHTCREQDRQQRLRLAAGKYTSGDRELLTELFLVRLLLIGVLCDAAILLRSVGKQGAHAAPPQVLVHLVAVCKLHIAELAGVWGSGAVSQWLRDADSVWKASVAAASSLMRILLEWWSTRNDHWNFLANLGSFWERHPHLYVLENKRDNSVLTKTFWDDDIHLPPQFMFFEHLQKCGLSGHASLTSFDILGGSWR
mmetsp:Transcript_3953/g.9307  ORF Transcript_3953/g.9307 Transcript_3953/m.9307 type:complete len:207 (+) Transcript_3953:123-743(+)